MYDYLILGQGLAGSLLAWQLIQHGKRVLVVDDGHRTSSSRVAAGLVNPLAGMRFNAAPHTDAWLKALQPAYRLLTDTLGSDPYLHEVPMQRLLRSPEQRRFYERQQNNPEVSAYLGRTLAAGEADPGIQAPYGGFEQRATGYVDLPRLLGDLRDWLKAQQSYVHQEIAYDAVEMTDSGATIGQYQARQLVCCEGYRMLANPWFNRLPLQPDKGELLRLRSQRPLCQHIINGAYWMIPLANGDFRFGATHEHQRIDNEPTEEGLGTLATGMHKILEDTTGVDIKEHVAGVRPSTSDRQPLLGTHPDLPRLHLFNGFGARGALSIPWYSQRMANYLLKGQPLPPNADIRRYMP